MIKELEKLYHQYDEQKKVYSKFKNKLSIDEKYSLVYEFMNSKRDFWGYFQLICDISLELSDTSDKFIKLLSVLELKIRTDMAQKPFIDLLIDLGKKEFGFKLFRKIVNDLKIDDNLRIMSGLILGSASLKNSTSILMKNFKEPPKYPFTNAYLRAMLLYYETNKLSKESLTYCDKILKLNNYKLMQELVFFALRMYKKDPAYFYNIIKEGIKLNNQSINWLVFNRLVYNCPLSKKHFFDLVNIAKNYELNIIDEIIEAFRRYTKEHIIITDLFIYWMNKFEKFELDSRNFRWVLDDLAKHNKLFMNEFFKRYEEIQPEKKMYWFTLPYVFEICSKYHQEYALKKIMMFKISSEENEYIFYELCHKLIGNIYVEKSKLNLILKLNNYLINKIKNRDFITFNLKKYNKKLLTTKNKIKINKDDYEYFVNEGCSLIKKLENNKKVYNFNLIKKNISKYPLVADVSKNVLDNLEKEKKFSPLLWLGETETPNLNDVDIKKNETGLSKNLKINFLRNKFWSKAYLIELESDLNKYIQISNEKNSNLKRKIFKEFSNENSFWSFQSELLFINKFSKKNIFCLEPKVPHNPKRNLDLKINLFNKDIYFEIKRPQMDRNLKLSNSAVSMPNKALQTIKRKFNQIRTPETIREITNGSMNDLFFIVIDCSSSTISEHEILNAFYGSDAITLIQDNKTRKIINQYRSRKPDSIHIKDTNTDIISGVIYFKQILFFDENNSPYIKITGNIIQNPKAINKLNETELKKLKKIIFN